MMAPAPMSHFIVSIPDGWFLIGFGILAYFQAEMLMGKRATPEGVKKLQRAGLWLLVAGILILATDLLKHPTPPAKRPPILMTKVSTNAAIPAP
jgi:hypothetical protein